LKCALFKKIIENVSHYTSETFKINRHRKHASEEDKLKADNKVPVKEPWCPSENQKFPCRLEGSS
jgi:hypothetical protein